MARDEAGKTLPRFSSIDEAVRFAEENDLADYLDSMPEGRFEVDLKKRVPIERDLYEKVDHLAHEKGLAPEALIEAWVRKGLASEQASR